MGRVGCMPCIHARKDELLEISRRFPEEIERVAEWERIVARAGKHDVQGTTFFTYNGNRGKSYNNETYERGNIHAMVEWSKTSRGGTQYDFLRTDNDGPLCSSIYGLCE